MKKLEVFEDKAKAAYQKGSKEIQQFMTELFGERVFSNKITDRATTFEEVCAINDLSFKAAKDWKPFDKLELIIKTLNEGWVPDWSNTDQLKHYPWFKYVPGSGFALFDFSYDYTGTNLGSRLVFKSRELAEHAVKYFLSEYNDFLTI